MKTNKVQKIILIVATLILLTVLILGGLGYWKIKKISQSFLDSAKKASTQNTPIGE